MISATENIVSACLIKSITDFDIGNYGQIIDKRILFSLLHIPLSRNKHRGHFRYHAT